MKKRCLLLLACAGFALTARPMLFSIFGPSSPLPSPSGTIITAQHSDQQWDSVGNAEGIGQTTGRIGSGAVTSTGSVNIITVTNFDFNGSGTTSAAREKWSVGSTTDVSDAPGTILGVQAAVSINGTTTVLTATSTLALDYKLYYRGSDIALPAGAVGWDKLEIRLRQLTNGVPVDFVNAGTIFSDGLTGGFMTTAIIPITSGISGGNPVAVTTDTVDKWIVVTYDLSAEATTAKFKQNFRMDPYQGANTSFEIDYIKLTAIDDNAATTNLTTGLVVPFWIPDLAGREILGAELRATLNVPVDASVTNAGNVDVYGVRSHTTSATTVASDYTSGTLLVDNWFKLQGGLQGTQSTTNSSALASWLTGQAETNGQRYVFLTIRPDAAGMSTNCYALLNTGDAATNQPTLILTLGTNTPPPTNSAVEWHVSPNAPAGGDGSAAKPLSSINTALGLASAGEAIVLHDGTYRERMEIRFPGYPGEQPLIIRAAAGAQPILSGMRDITGWGLWTNGIYTNQVSFDARDLFVGSMRQRMARWPDVNDTWLQKVATNSSGLTYTGAVPPAVTSTQMYFYGYIPSANSLGFLPVTAINDGQVVVPAASLSQLYSWNPTRFFLLNAPEFITQPGEWAREAVAGGTKLYFKPNSTSDLPRTGSRVLTDIFSIGQNFSANMHISGLTFDGALGNAITIGVARDVTIEDCVFLNCGNDKIALATGAGAGVAVSACSNIEIRRCLAFLCNLGFGVAQSSNVVIEACEAAFNDGDGIIISGGLNRSNTNQAYRSAENVRIQNVYLHHHIYQGHPDNMQYYTGIKNIEVLNMLGLYATQQIMSEEAGGITVSNSVFIGTGARHLICGKDGALDCDWIIRRNTFFASRYSAFGSKILGIAIDGNIFLKGGYTIDANLTTYVSDRNLFASDPSSRLQTIAAPTPAPSVYGQEANSVFATEAYLANLPGFAVTVDGMGVSTRSVLKIPADQNNKRFYVGDIVEVNGDGIQRTVTATNSTTITISPQLPEAPFRESMVFNWETNTNFQLDSRPTASTSKINGEAPGSSINISAYQMGDFDGDGQRDLPAIPASAMEAWPDPNVYVYPFNKP